MPSKFKESTENGVSVLVRRTGGHATTAGTRAYAITSAPKAIAVARGARSSAVSLAFQGFAETGDANAVAVSLGRNGSAKAPNGGWLVLAYWLDKTTLANVKAFKVGRDVQAGRWYSLLANGSAVESAAPRS